MRAESERLYSQTFWSKATHTPYFSKDDPNLPPDHPKRYFQERSSGYVNSDILEPDSDFLKEGDMQIFKGRFSLHRVTKVNSKKRRVIALPSYTIDPYPVNRPAHSTHLYGRALPIHYEREHYRPDGLTD